MTAPTRKPSNYVDTVNGHEIYRDGDRHYLWTRGTGWWDFAVKSEEEARCICAATALPKVIMTDSTAIPTSTALIERLKNQATGYQRGDPKRAEFLRDVAAALAEQDAALAKFREALKTVAEMTMLATSDPHATAEYYRSKLAKTCNVALAALATDAQEATAAVKPKDGVALIAEERQRQVSAEGWTPEHDDEHRHGEMAVSAARYALHDTPVRHRIAWQWESCWWKPKDPVRNLVRAGALIASEIDRRQRAEAAAERPAAQDERRCAFGHTSRRIGCPSCHALTLWPEPASPRSAAQEAPPQKAIDVAIQEARRSPCRSKRGAVVYSVAGRPPAIAISGRGHNRKPSGFECDGSAACKATCRSEAVHAEQTALLDAGLGACAVSDLIHVKVIDGALVPSGGPSCVQCSKLALSAGIAGVWLYHDLGWRRYPTNEFHALSLAASSAPPVDVAALRAVAQEIEKAARKFPDWPTRGTDAAAIVGEESGELQQAVLQATYEGGSIEAVRKEAIQTAAMAIQFLLNLPDTKFDRGEQAPKRLLGEQPQTPPDCKCSVHGTGECWCLP